MKKRPTRENLALMLAPDLREVARLVASAREQLDLQAAIGWDAEERARRYDAMRDLDAALDLLLGKNRHRD